MNNKGLNIKKGMYVLTRGKYCYRNEIKIGIVKCIINRNKNISCWRGTNEIRYYGANKYVIIPEYTALWDKRDGNWCFRFEEDGTSCNSTEIIAASYDLKDINDKIMETYFESELLLDKLMESLSPIMIPKEDDMLEDIFKEVVFDNMNCPIEDIKIKLQEKLRDIKEWRGY